MERRRPGRLPLLALAAIFVITAALWALALWPVADAAPTWLTRTRVACFRIHDDGLPDLAGWLTLIGEPISLLIALHLGWGREVRAGLQRLAGSHGGRLVLLTALLALATGGAGVVVRLRGAMGGEDLFAASALPASYPRLDREAPPLALVDQRGDRVTLEQFRGRPVLITFAFAHCETVCPLLVSDLLAVQQRLREGGAARIPAALVITLDPWRDTPSRLPAIAREWGLGEDAHLLGGSPEEVEGALDAWGVDRWRDEKTGEVAHPALVYVLDEGGRITFAAHGGVDELLALLRRS